MKVPTFLILLGLGWLSVQPVSAEVITPQFGRTLWATGYVRSVHHVLVFDLGNETILGNTGGSKVMLGTSTEHTDLAQYFELAKHKAVRIRLHGYFDKTPAHILAQFPLSPSVGFTVDKIHSPNEPDR
jgi:hypothetical protein